MRKCHDLCSSPRNMPKKKAVKIGWIATKKLAPETAERHTNSFEKTALYVSPSLHFSKKHQICCLWCVLWCEASWTYGLWPGVPLSNVCPPAPPPFFVWHSLLLRYKEHGVRVSNQVKCRTLCWHEYTSSIVGAGCLIDSLHAICEAFFLFHFIESTNLLNKSPHQPSESSSFDNGCGA